MASARAGLYAQIIAAQNEIATLAHDPNQVVDAVIRRTQELTRSAGAVVEILDGDEVVYWAACGSASAQVGLRLDATTSLSGRSIAENRVLRCDDSERDAYVDRGACRRVGLRSMLVMPLVHEGRSFGVLKVLSPFPFAYHQDDVQTMGMMATLVGAVLGHALQYSDLLRECQDRAGEGQRRRERRERVEALIRARALDIVLQPMVHLQDRSVFAFEALSRFRDTSLGTDGWFALASEVGLGQQLELVTLRAALSLLEELPQPYRMSINASPDTIVSNAFLTMIESSRMSRLVVEITEHSSVVDYVRLSERLERLHAHGVLLAIDDAGAGFASLRHILHLSPDIIKLDISLTRGIDADPRRQTMVSAIRTFANGTNAIIVVEGVENERELATLQGLGIEYAQGYYLARPAPLEQLLPKVTDGAG